MKGQGAGLRIPAVPFKQIKACATTEQIKRR